MKRYIAVIFILFITSSALAVEDGDWWLKEAFSIPIGDLSLDLNNENRFNDRFFNYQRSSFEGGLNIPIKNIEGFSLEPGIKYVLNENNVNPKIEYLFDLKYARKKIFNTKWDWDIRNRWEFIDDHEKTDWEYQIRLRNKFVHPLPWKNSEGRDWKFYISDEPFYNFTKNDLT